MLERFGSEPSCCRFGQGRFGTFGRIGTAQLSLGQLESHLKLPAFSTMVEVKKYIELVIFNNSVVSSMSSATA